MTKKKDLSLVVLPQPLAICQLPAEAAIPKWGRAGGFSCITRTKDELSIVCVEEHLPAGVSASRGWRALRIAGTFDLSAVGILVRVLSPLRRAKVSIFAISTYDTDYVLVRESQLQVAISTLRKAGHQVRRE